MAAIVRLIRAHWAVTLVLTLAVAVRAAVAIAYRPMTSSGTRGFTSTSPTTARPWAWRLIVRAATRS